MRAIALCLGSSVILGLAGTGLADEFHSIERFETTRVAFEVRGPYRDMTLTIVGPHDFDTHVYSKGGAPSVDLARFGAVDDGVYTYQLSAAGDERIKVRSEHNNGRDARVETGRLGRVSASGTFLVQGWHDRCHRCLERFR